MNRSRSNKKTMVLVVLLLTLLMKGMLHIASSKAAGGFRTKIPLSEYQTPPISFIGRVSITLSPSPTRENVQRNCTGTVLQPTITTVNNGGVVLTAAHCLYDELLQRYVSPNGVTFIPQSHDTTTPQGTWQAQQFIIPLAFQNAYRGAFVTRVDAIHDYAFIVLKKNEDALVPSWKRSVTSWVEGGGAPVAVMYERISGVRGDTYEYYGHQGNYGYYGNSTAELTIYKDVKQPIYKSWNSNLLFNTTTSLTILRTEGLSLEEAAGGPWFVQFANIPTLVGLLATIQPASSQPFGMSPYLDDAWERLFVQAQNVIA